MRRIDFSKNGGLKFTQNIAALMQQTYSELFNAIGLAFGNKVILSGVELSGGSVSDGWILYNGEPIKFLGGAANTNVFIAETGTAVTYKSGISYTALFNKTATCGIAGSFLFSELVSIRTIASLNGLASTLDTNLTALTTAYNAHTHAWGAITGKPNGYITYVGNANVGNVGTTGGVFTTDITISIPNQGGTNYIVAGSLVGSSSSLDDDNNCGWVVANKTASSFVLSVREYSPTTQHLTFEFSIIKTL